jgi:hypothetical protein
VTRFFLSKQRCGGWQRSIPFHPAAEATPITFRAASASTRTIPEEGRGTPPLACSPQERDDT